MKTENSIAMLNEIAEEPVLFKKILQNKKEVTKDFVKLICENDIKKVYFSGCGSPGNVCVALKFAAIKLLKVDASYTYPALFNNHEGFNIANTYKPEELLLICPAESGRTKGPVNAARKAKELGMHVVCTTLNKNGILANESDVVIEKISGRELGLPSTKGHSTGLFTLLLCIVEAAHAKGSISENTYIQYMQGFNKLVNSVEDATMKTLNWFEQHQDIAMNATNYKIIGYGANYATAVEAMLKFIESHRRPTAAYELEEFMHGPIRSLFYDDVIFFICAEDCAEKDRMLKLYDVLKKHVKHCILVQSANDKFLGDNSITFDAVNIDLLSSVEYLVPFQVLSYLISDCLGLDMSLRFSITVKEEMEPSYLDA